MEFNFSKTSRFEGSNSNQAVQQEAAEQAEKAAKRARNRKILIFGGVGVAVVGLGTLAVKGVKKLFKKDEEIPAPAEPKAAEPEPKPEPKPEKK